MMRDLLKGLVDQEIFGTGEKIMLLPLVTRPLRLQLIPFDWRIHRF
jgi:hypothetical protein